LELFFYMHAGTQLKDDNIVVMMMDILYYALLLNLIKYGSMTIIMIAFMVIFLKMRCDCDNNG